MKLFQNSLIFRNKLFYNITTYKFSDNKKSSFDRFKVKGEQPVNIDNKKQDINPELNFEHKLEKENIINNKDHSFL